MKRISSLLGLLAASHGLIACTLVDAERDATIAALTARVETMQATLEETERGLAEVAAASAAQQATAAELATRGDVAEVLGHLENLPGAVAAACSPEIPAAAECEAVRRVVMSGDSMLLGEMEHVWLEPPGLNVEARIDTGASRSSISAEDVVEFERDGNKWVRFNIRAATDSDDLVEIERRIVRFVRVVQQADPEGTRRPVVRLRVRLGEVQDSFEFTLADRSHLDQAVLLGRNFLTDIAVVDVAQRFVQPKYVPPDDL